MKYISFVDTSGKQVDNAATGFATLADNTTYYAELAFPQLQFAGIMSMHWDWVSLVATITIEATNHYDVTLHTATGDRWKDIAAIADVVPAGNGSDIASWADNGYGRMRAKVVVGAGGGDGGTLRGAFHYKTRGN